MSLKQIPKICKYKVLSNIWLIQLYRVGRYLPCFRRHTVYTYYDVYRYLLTKWAVQTTCSLNFILLFLTSYKERIYITKIINFLTVPNTYIVCNRIVGNSPCDEKQTHVICRFSQHCSEHTHKINLLILGNCYRYP